MITKQLLEPESIVIIGASNNIRKPGGMILKNIIEGGYSGKLFVINSRETEVQGITSYPDCNLLPDIDLAILAVPAAYCREFVLFLAENRSTKGFIVLSAGFSEESAEGAKMEAELAEIATKHGASLVGPNCVGIISSFYNGIFTSPVPKLDPKGCDLVSGSGGTALFILESALPKGLSFANMFTVGNSAQIGIEDVLEHWDNHFDKDTSPRIKLIYVENIKDPDRFLKHSSSLIRKGCKIAAIKSGITEAGKRATSSHTGAIASSDSAVEALFRKAGIVRCTGREEMTTVASIFMQKELTGRNIAIVTHAGGPAVMLTDAISEGGLKIPKIKEQDKEKLLSMLNPGASASNPIDIIGTGTADQLGKVIEYADKELDYIDGMTVIFGNIGLNDLNEAYGVLHDKILTCKKPIFPILPAVNSAPKEMEKFLSMGHINFPDEVVLGKAITKVYNTPSPAGEEIFTDGIDLARARKIIDNCFQGFQDPQVVQDLLESAGIPVVKEGVAKTKKGLLKIVSEIGFPVALKTVGPVHKSEVGGVTLNIKSEKHLLAEYRRMKKIRDVKAVLVQKMQTGTELFIGAKYEPRFGHVIICGLGGIFVEVLGDHSSGLAPLTFNEAYSMIRNLKSYAIIHGTRGKEGINEDKFAEIIVRLSTLLRNAVEIKEIDLNPLIGNKDNVIVVDARILIEK